MTGDLAVKVRNAPRSPGVYLMKDAQGGGSSTSARRGISG